MKDLKPYLIEFEKNGSIKIKKYLDDCIVEKDKHHLTNVIIYDKYTFFANN